MVVKRIIQVKWLAVVLFILLLMCLMEILSYKLNSLSWLQLNQCKSKRCTKLLLVADPQLIGLRNEIFHLITPLSIFDSDMFLARTYSYAFEFTQPDVVIFLGDLFDEGSIATEAEYKTYLRRLFDIFLSGPSANVKHIWIPGDNDIGGEGNDFLTDYKIKRFEKAFLQPDIIGFNNLEFYKINMLTRTIPVFYDKRDFYNTSRIIMGLSHISVLFTPSTFSEKVLSKLQPHLVFSGHNHESMVIAVDNSLRNERHITPLDGDSGIFECVLGDQSIYDILVPSCSYRMGTAKIGYGYAIIDDNKLQYTVLWSHSRFVPLLLYLIFSIFIAFIIFYKSVCCKCKRSKYNSISQT
ncbi:uncharacterized protein LOC108733839 [Agrilus planipennis]|uniref:Uncharacterized protein LOC108733839 n=1 Tax=Agrilus planipennis TaxID=224129 RepID=A0A1W4W9F7_AGRPL|nr:uncharacterized protein LOC108733839 [Agrilus planipennis]